MSETKWTPGPWRIKQSGNLGNAIEGRTSRRNYDGDDGYRTIAMYQDACDSELYADQEVNRIANARLIAAAPELYEALNALCGWHENDPTSLGALYALNHARAVLAKTRGETP